MNPLHYVGSSLVSPELGRRLAKRGAYGSICLAGLPRVTAVMLSHFERNLESWRSAVGPFERRSNATMQRVWRPNTCGARTAYLDVDRLVIQFTGEPVLLHAQRKLCCPEAPSDMSSRGPYPSDLRTPLHAGAIQCRYDLKEVFGVPLVNRMPVLPGARSRTASLHYRRRFSIARCG